MKQIRNLMKQAQQMQARIAELQGEMAERREELALEAAREGGKPLVDSRVEVDRAIDGVQECVELLRTQAGRGIPMDINRGSAGRLAFTQYAPFMVRASVLYLVDRRQFLQGYGRS